PLSALRGVPPAPAAVVPGAPGGAKPAPTRVAAPVGGPAGGPGEPVMQVGRAQVRPKPVVQPAAYPPAAPPPRPPRVPVGAQVQVLKRGGGWSWFGAIFLFCCWCIWAIANWGHDLTVPAITFGLVLVVAGGLFALARVVGRYVVERWMGRPRRTARLSHLLVAAFLVAVGIAYLREVPWVISLVTKITS
ncbi:MAG TPA: DNA-directed RNA polymerase II, partial [Rugosimonospora sp.]|nr:DNA-directed RNA polymerase II [Rugosimonospora sp.]